MTSVEEVTPPTKRVKLDNLEENESNIHENLENLSDFAVEEVLSVNTKNKTITLKGKFKRRSGVGIVLLEKNSFDEKHFTENNEYLSPECHLKREFSNDIYGNYMFFPKVELNGIKTTIIHPATEKHVSKYSKQNVYVVNETYDIYKDVVLPFVNKEQFSLEWLYNILHNNAEADRILYRDTDPETGFILLPDLKWDGKTTNTLYLIAITEAKNIKSLRDITGEHLDLLKNIYGKGIKAIEDKYGLSESQLRIYIHYQPSFYHLHVHFTYISHEAPGIYAERSHMLANIISNLELLPDYYQKAVLPFTVFENSNLYKHLVENKVITLKKQ